MSTKDVVHEAVDKVPEGSVALVLGTSKKVSSGNPNPYFNYRISAAFELYKLGKVKHFILSGDNREKYYNEPLDMQKALMAKGVPEKRITLDYAGLRTLDSVVRAKEVFGQDSLIIVTQKFHSYRSVFIANSHNIKAHAYAAKNLPLSLSFKVVFRELIARPTAVLDVFILNTGPKHLGDPVEIDLSEVN